jgi:phytanoyl-CoA hydroxylase
MVDITPGQIEQFRADGFIILREFLSPEEIQHARARFQPLFRGEFETGLYPDEWNWRENRDPPDRTRQICNGWKSDRTIARVVLAEKV